MKTKPETLSLPYRVRNSEGELVGALAWAEDAVALVASLGEGATISRNRRVLWREGAEEQSAGDSYDHAAAVVVGRFDRRPGV